MKDKIIKVIPSKSQLHRGLICSFLAGESLGADYEVVSKDIEATMDSIERIKNCSKQVTIDCLESGSTYRFLLPILGALGLSADVILRGKLKDRPMAEYIEALSSHGMDIKDSPQGIKTRGSLKAGTYQIPGDISSQYISGLLFALPILDGNSRIELTSPIKSKPYVYMTIAMINSFGVYVDEEKNSLGQVVAYKVDGNQRYKSSGDVEIEGDWSNGGFLLVAEAMSKEGVFFENLRLDSTQGDKEILNILEKFGYETVVTEHLGRQVLGLREASGGTEDCTEKKILIDGDHIPDLVPAIMALAAANKGLTEIQNCHRLRYKESDRVAATVELINNLGGEAWYEDGSIFVLGKNSLEGGFCRSYNDHRIVMMAALCSLISREDVLIDGLDAVDKSFMGFMDVMRENFPGVKLYRLDR